MTILYFYQYFSTPQGSWGTRVFEFAKRWSEKGDKIIVVTSIYDKSDLTSSGLSQDFSFNGVDVKVLNIKISNKQPKLQRIWTFIWYSILSSYYAVTIKADVVIASSGPITAGIPGLVAKFLRGRKLIFEVRDMWPEGAIQMGLISNPLLIKLAYKFERLCYKSSKKIVALSPGMENEIKEKGFNNVISVPNASDNDVFSRNTDDFVTPEWMKGKKVFLYTGNIGKVNNSFLIVHAAQLLKDDPNILFLFIGDGQQRDEILEYIRINQINNIRILGLMPKNDLVAFVQRAYIMLVPLEGKPILDTSSPNKLFDAMAAGIPVIQTTQGWIKTLLIENNCGFTVPYNNPEALAEVCTSIANNLELRNQMGLNSKKLATTEFERGNLSEKMRKTILEVVNNE